MVALPAKFTLKIIGNIQCEQSIRIPDNGNNQEPRVREFTLIFSRFIFSFDRSAKPGSIEELKALAKSKTSGNSRAPYLKTAKVASSKKEVMMNPSMYCPDPLKNMEKIKGDELFKCFRRY